ncbi:MAG: glycosyltransferase 87 family protein [Gaiellaceae bacterium]
MKRHPMWALAVGAVLVVLLEIGRVEAGGGDYVWLIAEAMAAGAALLIAWRGQEQLGLVPLLVLAAAYHVALVSSHMAGDIPVDFDVSIFTGQGQSLLDGDYPRSEYPTGAVSLFALETWLGDDSARTPNALLMIPFQLAAVAAVWSLRTRWSAWLAALVALWPLNLYAWEFKFDLVPAALLAVGLALAYRERFGLAGIVLGVGAAVKWTPALAALALLVWLLASRRTREGVRHAAGFVVAFATLTLPYLAWETNDVLAAYEIQGGRTITGESLPYLPLHWLGQAELGEDFTHAAVVPGWVDPTATVVQLLLVLGVLAIAWLVRGRLVAGVAVAAIAPAAFLLTNRIFSSQFLVVLLVTWVVAIALLARSRREQLLLGSAAASASFFNAFVYPFVLPGPSGIWEPVSALMFAVALPLTGWLLLTAARARNYASPL